LADHVISLLENKDLYGKIAENARSLIEKKFSWKEISKILENVYKSCIV